MNNHKMSREQARHLTEALCLARSGNFSTPGVGAKLESLARDAGHLWKYHQNAGGYGSATRALWDIIADACHMAYVLGHTDADYEAGRVLDSLESGDAPSVPSGHAKHLAAPSKPK